MVSSDFRLETFEPTLRLEAGPLIPVALAGRLRSLPADEFTFEAVVLVAEFLSFASRAGRFDCDFCTFLGEAF